MFLTKQHFEESLRIIEAYEENSSESDLKMAVAHNFAKELFEDFDRMKKDEQEEVISMIINDMSSDLYSVH